MKREGKREVRERERCTEEEGGKGRSKRKGKR